MFEDYELEMVNGHPAIELEGGLWVLDTGAPISFGKANELGICGNVFRPKTNYLGLNAKQLSNALQSDVRGLIGGDILNCFDSRWDIMERRVRLSVDELESAPDETEIKLLMSAPVVQVKIGERMKSCFFDTCAAISYVADPLEDWGKHHEMFDDFYPGFGSFTTEVFKDQIKIGAEIFQARIGVLPELLAASLKMVGCSGIVGFELFKNSSFVYAPRRHVLGLSE